jgi:hypothetical protein
MGLKRLTGVAALWMVFGLVGVGSLIAEGGLEIIHRAIEHHGGEIYERSKSEMTLCSGSGCYRIAVSMADGTYVYRVSGPIRTGHREVEATNDTLSHWHDGAAQEVVPANEQKLRDWAMGRIYFVYLPFRLNDPGVIQRDLGLETWEGRQLQRVKVTFAAGSSTDDQDEFIYWFDPSTARLEQFAYSFEGDPGGIRFRRLFNYRRVGGLLFFDQVNLGLEGEGLSVDQITPDFVDKSLREISTVTLEDIGVTPLVAGAGR